MIPTHLLTLLQQGPEAFEGPQRVNQWLAED